MTNEVARRCAKCAITGREIAVGEYHKAAYAKGLPTLRFKASVPDREIEGFLRERGGYL